MKECNKVLMSNQTSVRYNPHCYKAWTCCATTNWKWVVNTEDEDLLFRVFCSKKVKASNHHHPYTLVLQRYHVHWWRCKNHLAWPNAAHRSKEYNFLRSPAFQCLGTGIDIISTPSSSIVCPELLVTKDHTVFHWKSRNNQSDQTWSNVPVVSNNMKPTKSNCSIEYSNPEGDLMNRNPH